MLPSLPRSSFLFLQYSFDTWYTTSSILLNNQVQLFKPKQSLINVKINKYLFKIKMIQLWTAFDEHNGKLHQENLFTVVLEV